METPSFHLGYRRDAARAPVISTFVNILRKPRTGREPYKTLHLERPALPRFAQLCIAGALLRLTRSTPKKAREPLQE
jgi:hypothetical protein